ncbi:hypothetical protein FQN54_002149 [Arachnomyces sp. PD_36]|nr:hypothetical protein FQN54_002149 [Arachnomyces sp. PD_36]
MLNYLINAITPSRFPSALILVETPSSFMHVIHAIPENGTFEQFGYTNPSSNPFRHSGAIEQERQQVGEVTLYVGDGEGVSDFLDDVETRARKLWDAFPTTSPTGMGNVEMTRLIQDVLQPAALDAIQAREGRDRSMNATQTYPIFVVRALRSKLGRIIDITNLTSFPQ